MKPKDRNIPDGRTVLILVEGLDDLYTLSNYTGQREAEYGRIHFFPYAEVETQRKYGANALSYALHILPSIPGFQNIKAIGVLCDADSVASGNTTAKAATEIHIQTALKSAGWASPANTSDWIQCAKTGQWIGYLVMPPTGDAGSLETALWASIKNDMEPIKRCAEKYLECVEPFYRARFPERANQPNHDNWRDKVKVHAFLAGSEDPQAHTTNATLKGYWNFESPDLASTLTFLREGQIRAGG